VKSRRALLRHVWSMAQTRAEAAGLVLSLQRSALGRGMAWYAVAAMAAMAFMIALLLLIALGTPQEYRAWVLGPLSIALFATAAYCANHARLQLTRDKALIADFTKGLRLDLAMVNLALKDPETHDDEKLASRERAKAAVRDAAAKMAVTPAAAEGTGPAIDTDGPAMESVAAAMRAAASTPMPPSHERPTHGTP